MTWTRLLFLEVTGADDGLSHRVTVQTYDECLASGQGRYVALRQARPGRSNDHSAWSGLSAVLGVGEGLPLTVVPPPRTQLHPPA